MVPPASHKVSRVSWYSGSCQPLINFAYGIFTLSDQISQNCSAIDSSTLCSPQPRGARTTVWALSISLAATLEIEVSFFSSGYLDVSVPPVPFHTLWIGVWILEVCSSGFPHSDISGSMDICSSPRLFAACHVLLRLLMPRHSPCALSSLTCSPQSPLTSISTLLWGWESRPLPELSEKSWFSFKELCRLHRFLKL